MGFQVGFQLVERCADTTAPVPKPRRRGFRPALTAEALSCARGRLTRDRSRFAEPLDAIKFLCKDFWVEVFRKQVDNLKTNYRGVYVLQDARFRWLARVPQSPPPAADALARQLYFPCGLLRGALAALSVTSTVSAEVVQLPGCAHPSPAHSPIGTTPTAHSCCHRNRFPTGSWSLLPRQPRPPRAAPFPQALSLSG